MNDFLIIDTAYPINSRTEKFRKLLFENHKVKVLSWDRAGNENCKPDDYYLFSLRSEVGKRFKKLLFFPFFVIYGVLCFLKSKPRVIFASHWDSLVLACGMKLIKPNVKIVYDCLDIPYSKNKFVYHSVKRLERFCLRFCNLTIFASRYFVSLYPNNMKSLTFENYPSRNIVDVSENSPEWLNTVIERKRSGPPVISWIGVVRFPSVLEMLVESVSEVNVQLFVFGDGPSLTYMKSLVVKHKISDKVFFRGRYPQSEIPLIYDVSDFIWAAYPTNQISAIYAISNKFYECSFFRRVPFISAKTKMAEGLKGKYDNHVIIVDEFNKEDIKHKIQCAINGCYSAIEYEEVVFWEDRAQELIVALDDI